MRDCCRLVRDRGRDPLLQVYLLLQERITCAISVARQNDGRDLLLCY
jgi:hypothetical protein